MYQTRAELWDVNVAGTLQIFFIYFFLKEGELRNIKSLDVYFDILSYKKRTKWEKNCKKVLNFFFWLIKIANEKCIKMH